MTKFRAHLYLAAFLLILALAGGVERADARSAVFEGGRIPGDLITFTKATITIEAQDPPKHEFLRIFEDHPQLTRADRATARKTLRAIKRLGGNTVRIRTDSKVKYERAIRMTVRADLEPMVDLFKLSIPQVRRLVTRFKDDVDIWSVWNEPNHPNYYAGPVQADPKTYLRYYRRAYAVIHEADPAEDTRVLFGEYANDHSANLRLTAGYLSRQTPLLTEGVAIHPYVAEPNATYEQRFETDVRAFQTRVRRLGRKGALTTPEGKVPPMYATEFGVIRTNEWAGNVEYPEAAVARATVNSWRIARGLGLRGMANYKVTEGPDFFANGAPNVRDSSLLTEDYRPTMRSKALSSYLKEAF